MKTVLIVGIHSHIGHYLQKVYSENGWVVFGTTRKKEWCHQKNNVYLDLSDPDLSTLENIDADIIVFCAALTSIKQCEENKILCQTINVDSQLKIARFFQKKSNPFMIFLSSNAVFDGHKSYYLETDKANPLHNYGKSKADAENKLSSITEKLAILRLTKVLDHEHTLIKKWIQDLKSEIKIYPFSDLSLSPISIQTTVNAILKLSQVQKSGVYHLSGDRDVHYSDIAKAIAKKINADPNLIVDQKGTDAEIEKRFFPMHSTLDMTNTKKHLSLASEKLDSVILLLFNAV